MLPLWILVVWWLAFTGASLAARVATSRHFQPPLKGGKSRAVQNAGFQLVVLAGWVRPVLSARAMPPMPQPSLDG
jgi:hypothetical protein